MRICPATTVVAPKRAMSPSKSRCMSHESRKKKHFENTIILLNKQLIRMDTAHRMLSQALFESTIEEAVERLLKNIKEDDTVLATLFMSISADKNLPRKLTLSELAKGESENKAGEWKPFNQIDYERFQEKLGIAGRIAFSIMSERQGYSPVFTRFTDDFGVHAHPYGTPTNGHDHPNYARAEAVDIPIYQHI